MSEQFDKWIAEQFWAECLVDDIPNFRKVWNAAIESTHPQPSSKATDEQVK